VEGTATPTDSEMAQVSFGKMLRNLVFSNPYIWIIAVANFFVYTVRYGILDWGPTFLKQAKGLDLSQAGWMVAAFEVAGITGMLASGWLTDRVFRGRGTRTCLVYMALCVASLLLFWKLSSDSVVINTILLCAAGFFYLRSPMPCRNRRCEPGHKTSGSYGRGIDGR
jgi:sugar phosphate permease